MLDNHDDEKLIRHAVELLEICRSNYLYYILTLVAMLVLVANLVFTFIDYSRKLNFVEYGRDFISEKLSESYNTIIYQLSQAQARRIALGEIYHELNQYLPLSQRLSLSELPEITVTIPEEDAWRNQILSQLEGAYQQHGNLEHEIKREKSKSFYENYYQLPHEIAAYQNNLNALFEPVKNFKNSWRRSFNIPPAYFKDNRLISGAELLQWIHWIGADDVEKLKNQLPGFVDFINANNGAEAVSSNKKKQAKQTDVQRFEKFIQNLIVPETVEDKSKKEFNLEEALNGFRNRHERLLKIEKTINEVDVYFTEFNNEVYTQDALDGIFVAIVKRHLSIIEEVDSSNMKNELIKKLEEPYTISGFSFNVASVMPFATWVLSLLMLWFSFHLRRVEQLLPVYASWSCPKKSIDFAWFFLYPEKGSSWFANFTIFFPPFFNLILLLTTLLFFENVLLQLEEARFSFPLTTPLGYFVQAIGFCFGFFISLRIYRWRKNILKLKLVNSIQMVNQKSLLSDATGTEQKSRLKPI